jgi:hypothetical protein
MWTVSHTENGGALSQVGKSHVMYRALNKLFAIFSNHSHIGSAAGRKQTGSAANGKTLF